MRSRRLKRRIMDPHELKKKKYIYSGSQTQETIGFLHMPFKNRMHIYIPLKSTQILMEKQETSQDASKLAKDSPNPIRTQTFLPSTSANTTPQPNANRRETEWHKSSTNAARKRHDRAIQIFQQEDLQEFQ